MIITFEQFRDGAGASDFNAHLYYEDALKTMERYAIDNDEQRIAAFLATMSVETSKLAKMEEDLSYRDPFRLAALYPSTFKNATEAAPYVRNPQGLSQKRYKGFHGRGGCMLTWEENYLKHSSRLAIDFHAHPELLLKPQYAMLIAGDFWDLHQCNEVAGDMDEVTHRVNGPRRLALAERIAQRNAALEVLA